MRVHIWCPRASDSAVAIRDSLQAKGITAYKTWANQSERRRRLFLQRVRRGDLWINWGVPYILPRTAVPVVQLNGTNLLDKKEQLLKLAREGVATLEVSNVPREGFIGRSLHHQEGNDLIGNYGRDYYTKKLTFSRELRIHIYKDKSIHAGLKVPRTENPHAWIRSYNAGWKIDYARAKDIAQSRRELAKQAIRALGLDFGAVDIGVERGDRAVVLEVNTAPGLDEGPSVEAYVQRFMEELR